MSKNNSLASKAERRAAREAAKESANAATARHTVCRVCDRRRQTSMDGVCGRCISAFAGVAKLLEASTAEPVVAAEGQDLVVSPPTVASTAGTEPIGS